MNQNIGKTIETVGPWAIGVIWCTIAICIVITIIRRIKYNKAKRNLYKNINDEAVNEFCKKLSHVSIVNNPNSWNDLKSVFFYINNSDKVSTEIKEKIYNEVLKKGCNLGNVRINKSKNQIIKEQEELIKESGRKGEENVAYSLKWLDDKYKVIHNVKLNHKIEPQEFDTIVIGPNGIFHIETKNEGGINGCKIIIDNDGNWRRIDEHGEVAMRNPIAQVDRHSLVLRDILDNNFGKDVYNAIGLIVLANDKTIIEGADNCELPVIKVDKLARFITNYTGERQLSSKEIDDIIAKINETKIKK